MQQIKKNKDMEEKYRIVEIRNVSTVIYYQYTDEGAASVWKRLKEESENKTNSNFLIAASLDEYHEEIGIFVQKEHILFKVQMKEIPKLE